MSEIENSLNASEQQTLFSAMTKEDTNSFDQQQQYQEQNLDDYSGETSSNNTPTELTEIPQSPTQLSSIESTISSPSTLEHNYNSSDSSNSSNSSTISSFSSTTTQSDYDTPFNPISFLNTMHQKLKTSEAPVYTFSHDPVTGHFYCQVNFCGQTYVNSNACPKKQQAKEAAASIAMKDLSSRMPEITDVIRQELIRARSLVSQKNKYGNNKNINQISRYNTSYQPPELISKSLQWYNRQVAQAKSNGQEKRPCVLLLEFCQMHRIGHPIYNMRDDGRGLYFFDCTVFNRTFIPQMAFWKKGDAKDHVSNIAFSCLYREFFDKEQHEIQQSYGIYGMSPPLPPHPSFSYPNVADANNLYLSPHLY